MAVTNIRGSQILNNTVQRQDLDVSTVGQAVVTKIVQGSGITLSSTGADSGTGDVTVTSPDVVSTDAGNIAVLGSDSHILVPQSQITLVRLRSINILGNPTFEVDQRNVGTSVTAGASTWALDRWQFAKNAGTTMAATGIQTAGPVSLPGTNFALSASFYRVTLTATQASLGASDIIWFTQSIEGPLLRELISDVTSAQILVRSSVAGLKFGLSLRDGATTRSLTKLCTISSANTWTLITLPNLPLWSAGASFPITAGTVGYLLSIALAAGSTFTAPANDTWQTGNFVGALGQSNFAASALNSTFDIAFIQHEPGALCTTPIDCPFGQNLDGDMGCLRYFDKSYDYTAPVGGTSALNGFVTGFAPASGAPGPGLVTFKKRMAKGPTMTLYSTVTGAANTVRDGFAGLDRTVSSVGFVGDGGYSNLNLSSTNAAISIYNWHHKADTGW